MSVGLQSRKKHEKLYRMDYKVPRCRHWTNHNNYGAGRFSGSQHQSSRSQHDDASVSSLCMTSTLVEEVFDSKHVVVIGITPKQGDIYQPVVLEKVQRITAAFLQVPGVVKENLLSLSAKRAKNIAGTTDGLEVKGLSYHWLRPSSQ